MPSPEVKEYQNSLKELLSKIYSDVQTEWAAMSDEENMYSPRIDIAVGPFATNMRRGSEYDEMMNSSRGFIEEIIRIHTQNIESLTNSDTTLSFDNLKYKNHNARCLLAIEIENKVTRKQLIGSAVNAAALGRIGIVVAWTHDKLKAFIRLRKYLQVLGHVGKNTFDTTNLLILDKDQLQQAIQKFISKPAVEPNQK